LKVGLLFSTMNGLISRAIDVEQLAANYSNNCFVSVYENFFSIDEMQDLLKKIEDNSLDAVLLIGESPLAYRNRRSAEHLLERIEDLGINPNKIGFVNLNEQLALVHPGKTVYHFEKAKLMIDAEIMRLKEAEGLEVIPVAPRKTVAVIGATTTGYMAAQQLLRKNYTVHMIEKNEAEASDVTKSEDYLQPLKTFVFNHPNFNLHTDASINELYGYAGDYSLALSVDGSFRLLTIGAVIIADVSNLVLTRELQPLLHIDIDEQGYFRPKNLDTLSVYSSEPGIFLIPREAVGTGYMSAVADSAVLAVIELLDCQELRHKIAISETDTLLCSGCGTCVKTCLFHACKIDPAEKVSIIDAKRCKGCGSCVTACPAGARDLLTYPKQYLFNAVDILSQMQIQDSKILVFLCEGCGYQALDAAALKGVQYPIGVLPLKVRCGGTIDTQLILEAFHRGFDGVVICKCQDGHCSNITGNIDLDRRANLFREVLRSRRIDPDCMRIVDASQTDSNKCIEEILELYQALTTTGGGCNE